LEDLKPFGFDHHVLDISRFQEVINPNFIQNFSVQRSEIDSLVFKFWIWKPNNMIFTTHAEIFFAVPCGLKFKLFVLMSRFKISAWFSTTLPTAVSAAAVACSKTLAAEA